MEISPYPADPSPAQDRVAAFRLQGQALRVAYGHPCTRTPPPVKRTVEWLRKNGIFNPAKGQRCYLFCPICCPMIGDKLTYVLGAKGTVTVYNGSGVLTTFSFKEIYKNWKLVMKTKLIVLALVSFSPIIAVAQSPIMINLSIDGKECICNKYSIALILEDSVKEIMSKDGYFVPDTTFSGRGEIAIRFGKKELLFMDFNLENYYKAGKVWDIAIDYYPLAVSNPYAEDPNVKWTYSLVPGNTALIMVYRYTKPIKIRCKKN
jgi:hypothetical protein